MDIGKLSPKDINDAITEYKSTEHSPESMADAFKIAKGMQEKFKANSEEHKLIESFKKYLMTSIRKSRPEKNPEAQFERIEVEVEV